jgi:hypothetical protein
LIALASIIALWRFTAEDSWITARYAENLVERGELAFNPGEPVNALPSPALALFQAFLYSLTGSSLGIWKLLGTGLFAISGAIALYGPIHDDRARTVATPLAILPSGVVLWAVGGGETALLMIAVTGMTAIGWKREPPGTGRLTAMWALAGLALVTRFDSWLFTVPVLARATWRGRSRGSLVGPPLAGLALPVAWLVFSRQAYGTFFSTSHILRAAGGGPPIAESLAVVAQQLVLFGWVPALLVLLAIGRPGRGVATIARGFGRRWGVALGALAMLASGIARGDAAEGFAFRFFVPFAPAVAMLIADLWQRRLDEPWEGGEARRFGPAALALVVALMLLQIAQTGTTLRSSLTGFVTGERPYSRTGAAGYADGLLTGLGEVAEEARRHWEAHEEERRPWLLSFSAGRVPYLFREADVYEPRFSYRPGWTIEFGGGVRIAGDPRHEDADRSTGTMSLDLREHSDYLLVLTPARGSIESQLPEAATELVAERRFVLDGEEQRLLVHWNPEPRPHRLPPPGAGGS